MHADTEQLLALRDGADGADADGALVSHLESCEECQHQLAELRATTAALQGLPPLAPPGDGWERIEATVWPARRSAAPVRFAIAATVIVALAAGWWLQQGGRRAADSARAADTTLTLQAAPTSVSAPGPDAAPARPGLDELLVESRRLERLLDALETRAPRVMRTGTAGTIAGLEDRIALIDYGLTHADTLSADDSRQLWKSRVTLMNSLVQVRGARLQPISN